MDILTNKQYKNYSKLSRYSAFPFYYHTRLSKYVYGKTSYLDNTTLYKTHLIQRGDTLDSLALKYYNNPTLFWIICSFNRINDPFIELKEGETIKIPTISNIEFLMD